MSSNKPKYKKYRICAEATVEVMNMNAKDVHDAIWLTLYGDSIKRAKITVKRCDTISTPSKASGT